MTKKLPPKKKAPPKKKVAAKKKKAKAKKKPPSGPEGETKAEKKDRLAKHSYLRHFAQMYYVTDLSGCTIEDVCNHPMMESIPVGTIKDWAHKDRWAEKRKGTLDRWREQIESKIGDELVQSRIQSIKKLGAIRDHLFKKLTPNNHLWEDGGDVINLGGVPYETCAVCGNTRAQHIDPFAGVPGDKAVKALMQLVDMEFKMQALILEVTQTPGYGARTENGGSRPALPEMLLKPDEARDAAMAILRKRREEMRGATS